MVIRRDSRADYIAALEAADRGDLALLVRLFGKNAKRAFTQALTLSEDILTDALTLPKIVTQLADTYEARRKLTLENYKRVEDVANKLVGAAHGMLEEVGTKIKNEFEDVDSPPRIHVTRSRESMQHYYTAQIIKVAQDLGYWANVSRRRDWVRLHLVDGQKTHIVFSFHYLGKVNRGVMVCTAFVYFPSSDMPFDADPEKDDESPFGETHRSCSEPFVFSYQDEERIEDLKAEMLQWMSDAISVGLAEWLQRV